LRAHPYVRTHLATHAALCETGRLDALVADPLFLIAADRARLLRNLPAVEAEAAREARHVYELAAHCLSPTDPGTSGAYLALAASQSYATGIAERLSQLPLRLPWIVLW